MTCGYIAEITTRSPPDLAERPPQSLLTRFNSVVTVNAITFGEEVPALGTVGIREVAQRAGVSPGTVSNVLNRPERVAAPTRARVEQAIRELGFVRNGSAATLRAGQSRAADPA